MYFHGIKLHSLKYSLNMPALCWHSTPTYYAFYYAGIFDGGLVANLIFVEISTILDRSFHQCCCVLSPQRRVEVGG